ncbi:MAG: hypothetical protein ACK2UY_04340, partial [Anaerolineae bacterium]
PPGPVLPVSHHRHLAGAHGDADHAGSDRYTDAHSNSHAQPHDTGHRAHTAGRTRTDKQSCADKQPCTDRHLSSNGHARAGTGSHQDTQAGPERQHRTCAHRDAGAVSPTYAPPA